jgi:hypothetical protein
VNKDLLTHLGYMFMIPPTAHYLCFGSASKFIADWADETGWYGVYVAEELPSEPVPDKQTRIKACMGADAHLVKMMEGHYEQALTTKRITTQFPGPYCLMCFVDTGRDRELFFDETLHANGPRVYVLREDDHNEEVIASARFRGYHQYKIIDDFLVLWT